MTHGKRERRPTHLGVDSARPDAKPTPSAEADQALASQASPAHRTSAAHNNLSLPRSPLIGREHEIHNISQLLLQEHIGLLTLTGPGGIGKTRLALQVAANLLDHFIDGVYFVSLAPIRDPVLVGAAIAQTLGVREAVGQSLSETLQIYLKDRQLLLVLDNFEQVVAAAALIGDLLNTCRRLKVLVTSRATLHLYGEQEFSVPPLALPDAKHLTTGLSDFAAIDLFCQRARAVKPDFTLTATNAADVAKICIDLDGLPLAIELAAARIKLFSPVALLARLDQRLTLLTNGPHDLPARQRTLRDDIAWSYDLLSADEQVLFRRLAVFVDGFTLEAAQAVGNPSAGSGQVLRIDVLDGVATLVAQNLLKQSEQTSSEARFGMLETIREYGLEQLDASSEAEAIRRYHANYFLTLAETVALVIFQRDQSAVLARLTLEQANLRSALAWSQSDDVSTEIALRLASALESFWLITGLWSEGRRWLEGALARTTAAERTETRAHALVTAGELAVMQGDHSTALGQLEEGLTIAREQGAHMRTAMALVGLGWIAEAQPDYPLAIAYYSEALAIARAIGDKSQTASALVFLGNVARDQRDYTRAQALYEEGLAIFQAMGDEYNSADTLSWLGLLAQAQGNHGHAWALFQESLARWRAIGALQWKGLAYSLEGIANICTLQRQFAEAERLFGAAEALREFLGATPPPRPGSAAKHKLAALRTQLDEGAFVMAWAAGRTLSPEQAVEYALALPDLSTSAPSPVLPLAYPAGLSAREVEVLRLLAQGLTYMQIADQLVVSRRTINAHVGSIYSKLAVNGRAAATRFAVEHHLV